MVSEESLVMRGLRLKIANKLCEIEDFLPLDYELTLIARHKKNDDSHICVTSEPDVSDAIKAIQKLYANERKASGGR